MRGVVGNGIVEFLRGGQEWNCGMVEKWNKGTVRCSAKCIFI